MGTTPDVALLVQHLPCIAAKQSMLRSRSVFTISSGVPSAGLLDIAEKFARASERLQIDIPALVGCLSEGSCENEKCGPPGTVEELCGTELTLLSVELAVEDELITEELSVLVLLTELLCTGVSSELVCTEIVVGPFGDSLEEQPETNVAEQSSAAESMIEICFFEMSVIKILL